MADGGGQHEALGDDERRRRAPEAKALNRRDEGIAHPVRLAVDLAPLVGLAPSLGIADGGHRLAMGKPQREAAEPAIAVIDRAAVAQSPVGGDRRAGDAARQPVQFERQPDCRLIVGRIDGHELADLAQAAPPLVEAREIGQRARDLEAGAALPEQGQGPGEEVRGRGDGGRQVQLPALVRKLHARGHGAEPRSAGRQGPARRRNSGGSELAGERQRGFAPPARGLRLSRRGRSWWSCRTPSSHRPG